MVTNTRIRGSAPVPRRRLAATATLFEPPYWLCAAALSAVVLLAYSPAWHGGMLWDDDAHLTREGLRSLSGLRAIWFDIGATQQYYPLVHSAFWLFFRLWGLDPLGYHLANITLHLASALLLIALLRRLRVPGAVLAGFVFALHPLQVESVAWMSGLTNTLSTALVLGAAVAYLNFDQLRRRGAYIGSLVLFFLALLSKTVTAVMPPALLVVFWWERGRLEWRRDVRPLVPFLAAGIGFGVLTAWFERSILRAQGPDFDLSAAERVLLAGRAIWFYLRSLAWPANLTFIYPKWKLDPSAASQWMFPAAVVLVLAALWWHRRRNRAPLAVALLFCGLLFPALGVLNLYPFRYSFVTDRFAYLASIPVIAGISAWLALRASRIRYGEVVLIALVALPLGAASYAYAHDYRDADTLYRATLARNPECWLCYNNLATARLHGSTDDLNEAVGYLREALRLDPLSAEVHNNMGGALQRLGRLDEALSEHTEAARLNPALVDARYNIGVVLQALGRVEEAQRTCEAVLREKPDHAPAHHDLATILARQGRLPEAIEHYAAAARLEPALPASHQALAGALAAVGRIDEAVREFRVLVGLQPGSAAVHHQFALLLATNNRVADAIPEFQAAVNCEPASAQLHHDLGAALANAGRYDEAAAQFNEVLRLEPDYPGVRETLRQLVAAKGS